MRPEQIRQAIARGETVVNKEPGNSMLPLIRSRQPCELRPINRPIEKGDVVFAKVRGRYYTHLVSAVGQDGRVQISNNHGHVNGWTKDVIAFAVPISD